MVTQTEQYRITLSIYKIDDPYPVAKLVKRFDDTSFDYIVWCGEKFHLWASDNGYSVDELDWDWDFEEAY